MKFQKILLTLIIVVFGSLILFLAFAGDDEDQALDVEFKVEQDLKAKQKSKSDLITSDVKKSQDEKEKPLMKQPERKDTSLDFNKLFRDKEKKADAPAATESQPVEEVESKSVVLAEEKQSSPVAQIKAAPGQRSKDKKTTSSGTSKARSEEAKTEEAGAAGFSFSTIEEQKPVLKKEQTTSSKGKKEEAPARYAEISVYGDYPLKAGSKLEFVLMEDIEIDGIEIPSHTIFTAYVKGIGQRITFKVTSIARIAKPFDIYDQDLEQGIYNTAYTDGSGEYRDAANDISDDVVTESGATELRVAQELFKSVKGNIKKSNDHGAYLDNGKKYLLKY